LDTGLHKALDVVLMTMLESHQGAYEQRLITEETALLYCESEPHAAAH
jgi:hypothetical protein